MNTITQSDIELSERLRKACLEKGITEPKFVAQDEDGRWFHYNNEPWISMFDNHWDNHDDIDSIVMIAIDYANPDWRDTLMEWNPNAGVPLADILQNTCEHCGKMLATPENIM